MICKLTSLFPVGAVGDRELISLHFLDFLFRHYTLIFLVDSSEATSNSQREGLFIRLWTEHSGFHSDLVLVSRRCVDADALDCIHVISRTLSVGIVLGRIWADFLY